MEILRDKLEKIAKLIIEMLIKKNTMYGNSYFHLRNEYGKLAFFIRLSDKFNRLKVLEERYGYDDDIDKDTIIDIIGYCLLELVYREIQNEIENITK